MLALVLHAAGALGVLILAFVALCRLFIFRRPALCAGEPLVLGFFHPYCNSGGGGERVLWCALRALEDMAGAGERGRQLRAVIYTGDVGVPSHAILARAKERFGVELGAAKAASAGGGGKNESKLQIEFVTVTGRALLEAHNYPRFTMIGQSLGSMVLAWEALRRCPPHVFVDTTGFAFSFAVAKWLAGCRVAAYVHYPTISTDMLQRVRARTATYNNDGGVAGSAFKSLAKLQYYRLFAALYGGVGRLCDCVMVNSNWTRAHVAALWGGAPRVVFPPCDVETFCASPLAGREPLAVSVGQFRPEKDHSLQLRAFAALLARADGNGGGDGGGAELSRVRLALVGSCRGAEDEARVAALRAEVSALGLGGRVTFHVNVSFAELQAFLARATVGLHTMWNEHFGIGVVEMMAAGVVTIAHDSGGPKADIVTEVDGQPTGFLASTADGYADAMAAAFGSSDGMLALRQRARASTRRFSDDVFHRAWKDAFAPTLQAFA
eukprot:g2118.t1